MDNTKDLLDKIDNYEIKKKEEHEDYLKSIELEIEPYKKAIKARANDIKDLVKIANRLGSIGDDYIYNKLNELKGDGIHHNLGFSEHKRNYKEGKITFNDYLVKCGGGACGDYTISILKNGDIIFEGNEVAPRDGHSLLNRLRFLKEFEPRIDELQKEITKIVEGL